MAKRTHMDATSDDSMIPRSLCGDLGGSLLMTVTPSDVDCKRCLRRLKGRNRPPRSHAAQYVEQLFHGAPIPIDDDRWSGLGSLPALDPSSWARYRSNCVCGLCNLCLYMSRIAQDHYSAPWRKIHSNPDRRARFRSANHALEWYMHHRSAETGISSAAQSLDHMRRLGTTVQVDVSGTPNAVMRGIHDAVTVEGALKVAYDQHNDRGLGSGACIVILLSRVAGLPFPEPKTGRIIWKPVPASDLANEYNVSSQAIQGIVSSGKARITEHLRARGYVD